jgi:hypothetical protein
MRWQLRITNEIVSKQSIYINSSTLLFFYWWGGTTAATSGQLYKPQMMIRMIVEQLVEWRFAGETEVLGENLPQRHFVHHKSHMTRPGLEPRAAAVGSQRLTAWAMARPLNFAKWTDCWLVLNWIISCFTQLATKILQLITTAIDVSFVWRILKWQLEVTACEKEGWLRVYSTSSRGQPRGGGILAWGLFTG